MEIVAFPGGVADEIEEELEEGTLVISLVVLCEAAVEDLQDSLKGVLEEDVGVVAGYQLVGDDDELGVVLDVGGVDRLVVGRNRLLHLLQCVV